MKNNEKPLIFGLVEKTARFFFFFLTDNTVTYWTNWKAKEIKNWLQQN